MNDLILLVGNDGRILFGIAVGNGVVSPIEVFTSFAELESFATGILGFCEYSKPKVPDIYIKAFEEEERNGS